jgi:hypothetical protein
MTNIKIKDYSTQRRHNFPAKLPYLLFQYYKLITMDRNINNSLFITGRSSIWIHWDSVGVTETFQMFTLRAVQV